MRVNTTENNNVNFKSIFMIQFAKEQFKHPENLDQVADTFGRMAPDIFGEQPMNKVQVFLNNFGWYRKKHGPEFFLEQPFYIPLINGLKQNGNRTLEWLSLHSGINIESPIDKKCHSFFVLEDEHQLQFNNLFQWTRSQMPELRMQVKEKCLNSDYEDLSLLAKVNEIMMDWIKPLFPDVYKD